MQIIEAKRAGICTHTINTIIIAKTKKKQKNVNFIIPFTVAYLIA